MTKTLEQAIGDNVARLRAARGLSQGALGKAVEEATGREWKRQSVWAAENGKRAFSAADLLGLASALGTSVKELLDVPAPVLTESKVFTPEQVTALTGGDTAQLYKLFHAAADVRLGLDQSQRTYDGLVREVRRGVQDDEALRSEIEKDYKVGIDRAIMDGAEFGKPEPTEDEALGYASALTLTAYDVLRGGHDG